MVLADLGADVIKIESHQHVDILRWSGAFVDGLRDFERSGYYLACNRGKRSVTLNLKTERGRALLLDLVDKADVVIENFAPRVMGSLGLTSDVLLARNRDLVILSLSGYGATGPDAERAAYGDHLLHASGLASITGHPDDQPTKIATYYGDPVAGFYGAMGVLAALDRVAAGGHGEHLEYSQVEGLVSLIPTAVMAVSAGETVGRRGDKSPGAVPHGFYRCAGEDAWVALSVRTDAEWDRFAPVVGWASAPLATLDERLAAQSHVDTVVSAWAAARSPWDATHACQEVRVAAYPLLSSQGLSLDDHLADRRFFRWVHRRVTGPGPIPGVSFRLAGEAVRVQGPAPVMGEHNEDVLVGLLGLRVEELDALMKDGVVD
jgi:crotonobetainyl-CoA:carnitine CoA-transferase CaiB-like acyl-CoA transferase